MFPKVAQEVVILVFLKSSCLKIAQKVTKYLSYFKSKFAAKNFNKASNLVALDSCHQMTRIFLEHNCKILTGTSFKLIRFRMHFSSN